ncbi:NTP transferase domain-containing protein [Candidatus Acetothermia bacterium]|nr:NTP transferase domain-containing protein [Candidatus Acetothermia bacterium]
MSPIILKIQGGLTVQAVLLAAGASSRFWPLVEGSHKSLFRLMGKPLIQWTIESLQSAGMDDFIVIQSPNRAAEKILAEAKLSGAKLRYLIQEKPLGMGDALMQAEPLLDKSFFLLHAHHVDAGRFVPLMREKEQATKAHSVLLGSETDRPQDYGILSLDKDRALDLIEKPAPGKEPSKTRLIGIYLLSKDFFNDYRRVPESEYAFEAALALSFKGLDTRVVMTDDAPPTLKYPWDLLGLCQHLMDRESKNFRIETKEIHPSAIIEGPVHIGKGTKILENVVLKSPCYIGENCIVGTGSLVRTYTNLENSVVIGAHAEVARSIFQSGCTTHSGYFGDSIFDETVKIGDGTTTANVRVDRGLIKATVKGKRIETGKKSLGAIIGRGTHLGIHTMLMPGIMIGPRCQIGPGTLVSKNVEADTLYFTRHAEIVRKKKKEKGDD